MATEDAQSRHVRRPTESVARLWTGLDRGWQATVLGIGVVAGTVLAQTL